MPILSFESGARSADAFTYEVPVHREIRKVLRYDAMVPELY